MDDIFLFLFYMTGENVSWEELSRESVFSKFGRGIDRVIFALPDGGREDFYIKNENPVVCCLALTPDNEVILSEQFRPGPKEVLFELPGGGIEKGEDPTSAITRELLEETGYSGSVQRITTSLDDAYSMLRRYCFVVTDCVKVKSPAPERGESGKIRLMNLVEFRDHLRSGALTDIEVGYLGLDYLHLL